MGTIELHAATKPELDRIKYWSLYAARMSHLTWAKIRLKSNEASDRMYETKPVPELYEVYADVEQYRKHNGECYLSVVEMGGSKISEQDSGMIMGVEHLYFCRMPWKKMSLPFIDHLLRQAEMRR